MVVIPIALTSVNWTHFMKVCQEAFGDSPTRGLDKIHMSLDNPASYLACMNMNNEPDTNLAELNNSFDHYSVSFLTVGDDYLINLLANTSLKLLTKDAKRASVIIATGTIKEWFVSMLIDYPDIELRQFFNACYVQFIQIGFKRLWANYTKQFLPDGTFRLVGK